MPFVPKKTANKKTPPLTNRYIYNASTETAVFEVNNAILKGLPHKGATACNFQYTGFISCQLYAVSPTGRRLREGFGCCPRGQSCFDRPVR